MSASALQNRTAQVVFVIGSSCGPGVSPSSIKAQAAAKTGNGRRRRMNCGIRDAIAPYGQERQ
jgi:hypothetical protein